jgi:predicted metal-dependent hydrolase
MANEWVFEQSEFINAVHTARHNIEVIVDREHVEVVVDEGSGYLSQHTTAYVPIEIMVRLLEHAGYSVASREPEVG